MKTKYAKLVVKDASGNIIQLLPETYVDSALDTTSNFPIANSAVATAIEALDINNGGTISADKIPDLDASKITTGTISVSRLPAAATAKEIGILSVQPTSSNTSSIDNQGLVFWSEGTAAGTSAGSPVLLSGNQTVEGQKKFLGGLYGGAYTMGTAEWAFDLTKATCFTKTATSSGTFSFTNVPTETACCITVILKNGGNYTVRWPASVKWSENTTPTLTTSGTDVFTFITCDGGTVWYGTTTCISVTA